MDTQAPQTSDPQTSDPQTSDSQTSASEIPASRIPAPQVHSLVCFGAHPGAGNPALVIEGAAPDAAARQAFARERGVTCVFIDQDGVDANGAQARIDYFYPHMRSPLCLHATLAVAAVLFARRDSVADPVADSVETIAVDTAMHGQRLVLSREDGEHGTDYFVRLSAQPAPAVGATPALAARLLGVPESVLPACPRVASVGSPKLLVQVADLDALYALAPDLHGIANWSKANGINGIYAWCRRADGDVEGRNFNHLEPTLEDSATGVAAGALGVALGMTPGQVLALRQGRATGRDCLIRARMEGGALLVGGAAEWQGGQNG